MENPKRITQSLQFENSVTAKSAVYKPFDSVADIRRFNHCLRIVAIIYC